MKLSEITVEQWFPFALAIGWGPLLGAEALRHVTDNYEVVGFGFAWGMFVTPLATLAALILEIAWIVRLLKSRSSN